MRTKAVIYARVSSTNDRQDTSRQIEDLKRYAESQNIWIVKIYEEHISGAKKIEERQVLANCLEYCKKESVNFLLLSELSRLGRSTLQVLRSLEILHEAKVSVYIQNLGLYTLQPDGKVNPIASIMVTVLAEMANIERSNIPEKTHQSPILRKLIVSRISFSMKFSSHPAISLFLPIGIFFSFLLSTAVTIFVIIE